MSRHIEYDLKNDIYSHYQQLDAGFFKTNSTGDMMNRITEDVSRVRMYAGPSIMYLTNLVALISFSLINMLRKDMYLTLIVVAPLPLLAIMMYVVNTIIHKKSENAQRLLSTLTTNAQEAYSGIRVIKSFVQEKAMLGFFKDNSEEYRKNTIGLARVDALYFPGISLMIGLSTLLTILVGGRMALIDPQKVGVIVEFVIYINMLTFPVSSIGWVASMIQRASASQKRINEFLDTVPAVSSEKIATNNALIKGNIIFNKVNFIYPHTGIHALKDFSLQINEGEKILILGKTGSGKSTIAQLLLRFYDAESGDITIDNTPISAIPLTQLRKSISYVPQDVFLFSDTVAGNINFGGDENADEKTIQQAAIHASIHEEINELHQGYKTAVGERGVTLSGGQKQRISIARALLKKGNIMLLDDSLSAVDSKTENTIIKNFNNLLKNKTTIIITHRIFTSYQFDRIVFLEDGEIAEQGTHNELMQRKGYYYELYNHQVKKHVYNKN